MENVKDIIAHKPDFQNEERENRARELIAANQRINQLFEELIQNDFKELSDYKYALDETSIIALTDHKGIIIKVNGNFCKISKYSEAELIGQDHRIINSGYHPKEFIRDLWQTIANGKVWKGELKNKAKDGTYYWVDTTIIPFLNKEGKPYQYIAIRTDISERKKNEEYLRQLTEQLKIANKNFMTFIFISSHDLQEPLRKIQIFVDKILEQENQNLSNRSQNYFLIIQKAAELMRQLIQDLLDFSQLSTADRKFEYTDLNVIVEEVKAELKDAIEKKQAIIEATDLCQVPIITFQFHQIIHHIISNALKYSRPDTAPYIIIRSKIIKGSEINYHQFSSESNYCNISISDNGIGFESQYKDQIFEMFQRLHNKDEFEGTGMGLAIVKKMVENHLGIITATSEVNKGATFDIYIPVT